MSTQTEHLGLHQWEPEDDFLRTDFNQDFAKIDAATGALQQWASTACVAGSVLITDSDSAIDIDLGFRPKLVLTGMCGKEYSSFNLYLDGSSFTTYGKTGFSPSSSVGASSFFTDTGFQIPKAYTITAADENKTVIRYVAFR